MAKTAIAYIDGHNFYHGAVKAHPEFKWLDFVPFCQSLLPDHRLTEVRYYTARVKDWPKDPQQSQRQDVFLRALATRPAMTIIHGQFVTRTKMVRTTKGTYVRAEVTEEKGSDVNLAADLVYDACHGNMDCALVVSNDFDLQRAIVLAMTEDIEVLVVNPHRSDGQSASVRGSGTRNLRRWHLRNNQLPNPVIDGEGREIHKPVEWG